MSQTVRSTWEQLARANGWSVESNDPNPDYAEAAKTSGPCLYHAGLDRIWFPVDDWEGACRDLGLDEEDLG